MFRWARRGKGVLPFSSAVHPSSARSSSSSVTSSALTIARRTSRSVRCTSTALRSPQQWRLSLFYEDSFCSTYPGLIIYCYLFKCLLYVPIFQINESKYSDFVFFLFVLEYVYSTYETVVIRHTCKRLLISICEYLCIMTKVPRQGNIVKMFCQGWVYHRDFVTNVVE